MLEIKNLKKSFRDKMVLKDVSFLVGEGEIVCLLGNNGAGKTTIINCILKMIKPNSGEIKLLGKRIENYKNKEYFTKVGALLESSVNIYDYLTGRENIRYFASLMNRRANEERTEKLIDLFELREAMDSPAGEYSRGMAQKLALTIALMSEPKLLLLDEPTLGLDIKSKLSVISILNKIVKEEKLSVILTTHQMDVVKKLDSRILILKEGKVEKFEKSSYYDFSEYIVSYMEEGKLKEEGCRGTFDEVYKKFANKEIVEVKIKTKDMDEVIMEVLDEFSER